MRSIARSPPHCGRSCSTGTNLARHKWVAEWRDCDDFARFMRGKLSVMALANGCGVILDRDAGHAYNFAIVAAEGDSIALNAFEPQAAGRTPKAAPWVTPGATQGGITYPMRNGVFIL